MKHRSLLVSLAALVSLCAIAADTATDIGLINDGSTVITAVDHTKLVNGTTQVIANQNGTASIVGSEQEKWIYSSTEGTVDLRWSSSGGTAGYWSGSMQNALHFRLVTNMDPLDTQPGFLDASVEFIRVEDYGDTNLLWKSPVRFVPNTSTPGIISWSSQSLIVGAPASEYASSGYTVDGTPTEQDLSLMTVGYSGTTTFAMDTETGEMTGYFTLAGPIVWNNVTSSHTGGTFSKTIATVDQIPSVPALATVATSGSYNDLLNKPINVSAFNNDAGYVKTNAQGTLVVGINQMQPNGGSWSLVMGNAGSHTKSDNTIILSPGSNIGTNSHYSAVFGPGTYIHDNAQYSFAFGGGINIQDNCNDSFVIGSGAQSAHKCAFLWSANSNGGETIPAQPITHGNGTFNINTYDGVAGVYIGNTNLQQIIRLEAKAMIHDAVSGVNVNLQSAEDTRATLTNLITILKNL